MIIVMATKDNMPTMQSRPATTPTGEESTIPVSQPSGLGELATLKVGGDTKGSNQFTSRS